MNLDAERRDLVDLAMELAAIAAIDVGEDRDGVLDLPSFGLNTIMLFGSTLASIATRARERVSSVMFALVSAS